MNAGNNPHESYHVLWQLPVKRAELGVGSGCLEIQQILFISRCTKNDKDILKNMFASLYDGSFYDPSKDCIIKKRHYILKSLNITKFK